MSQTHRQLYRPNLETVIQKSNLSNRVLNSIPLDLKKLLQEKTGRNQKIPQMSPGLSPNYKQQFQLKQSSEKHKFGIQTERGLPRPTCVLFPHKNNYQSTVQHHLGFKELTKSNSSRSIVSAPRSHQNGAISSKDVRKNKFEKQDYNGRRNTICNPNSPLKNMRLSKDSKISHYEVSIKTNISKQYGSFYPLTQHQRRKSQNTEGGYVITRETHSEPNQNILQSKFEESFIFKSSSKREQNEKQRSKQEKKISPIRTFKMKVSNYFEQVKNESVKRTPSIPIFVSNLKKQKSILKPKRKQEEYDEFLDPQLNFIKLLPQEHTIVVPTKIFFNLNKTKIEMKSPMKKGQKSEGKLKLQEEVRGWDVNDGMFTLEES